MEIFGEDSEVKRLEGDHHRLAPPVYLTKTLSQIDDYYERENEARRALEEIHNLPPGQLGSHSPVGSVTIKKGF